MKMLLLITPLLLGSLLKLNCYKVKWRSKGHNPEGKEYVIEVQEITTNLIQEAKNKYNGSHVDALSDSLTGPQKLLNLLKG